MGTHTVAPDAIGAHEIALTPNTVETVTLLWGGVAPIEVISDGAASIYYTLNGDDPTVAGDNCYVIPAGVQAVDTRAHTWSTHPTVVKLISTGSPTISVQRGN
jgi:hypothetical protein